MGQLKNTIINGELTVKDVNITDDVTVNELAVSERLKKVDTLHTKFNNIVGTGISLSVTTTNGSNYTVNDANAALIGNVLRIYFKATRTSSTSGNITNETVLTLSIDHGGRIANYLNVSFTSGTNGAVGSFYTTNGSLNDNIFTIDICAAAYSSSTTTTSSYFFMPVLLNSEYYNS